jgi:ABC-type spermidine/putrescine transport system permease subunit I
MARQTTKEKSGFQFLSKLKIPDEGLLVTAMPLILLEVVFFIGPLVIMFIIASMEMQNYVLVSNYGLDEFVKVFTKSVNRSAFINTTSIAALTTITAAIVAYPIAYYIARYGGKYQNQLIILVMIPFWTNLIVRIYGWKIILGSQGVINSVLMILGLINDPLKWLLYTKFSIWLGLTYLWLPFMILPLYSSLDNIETDIIEAAYDLGATRWAVFRRIILPLSISGLIGGTMFVFIFSMGAFIVPAMLGGGVLFVGTRIAYEIGIGGSWPMGAALGCVLMLIVSGLLWSLFGYVDLEEMFA